MAKTSIAGRGGAQATRGQFLRVELSIPEAQRLLQEYAHDRGSALEAVSKEFRNIAANVVNQLLNLELSLFLGSSESQGNRRNGYHRVPSDHRRSLSPWLGAPGARRCARTHGRFRHACPGAGAFSGASFPPSPLCLPIVGETSGGMRRIDL